MSKDPLKIITTVRPRLFWLATFSFQFLLEAVCEAGNVRTSKLLGCLLSSARRCSRAGARGRKCFESRHAARATRKMAKLPSGKSWGMVQQLWLNIIQYLSPPTSVQHSESSVASMLRGLPKKWRWSHCLCDFVFLSDAFPMDRRVVRELATTLGHQDLAHLSSAYSRKETSLPHFICGLYLCLPRPRRVILEQSRSLVSFQFVRILVPCKVRPWSTKAPTC